jgi:hypothetical protein
MIRLIQALKVSCYDGAVDVQDDYACRCIRYLMYIDNDILDL